MKPWLESLLLPRKCKAEKVAALAESLEEEGFLTLEELVTAFEEDPSIDAQIKEKCQELGLGVGHVRALIKAIST